MERLPLAQALVWVPSLLFPHLLGHLSLRELESDRAMELPGPPTPCLLRIPSVPWRKAGH